MLHYRTCAKHLLIQKVTLVSCSSLNIINMTDNNAFDYFMCHEEKTLPNLAHINFKTPLRIHKFFRLSSAWTEKLYWHN